VGLSSLSALGPHVLGQLQKAPAGLASEGSSTEDPLYRMLTPHQDAYGFTSPVEYSWLLTVNAYLDPVDGTRNLPTKNSAVFSQCCLKRLTLVLVFLSGDEIQTDHG